MQELAGEAGAAGDRKEIGRDSMIDLDWIALDYLLIMPPFVLCGLKREPTKGDGLLYFCTKASDDHLYACRTLFMDVLWGIK